MAILYRHIRPDKNEVFYVGIGKKISRAFSKQSRNTHWHNIVNSNNGQYEVQIILSELDWEEAALKEIEFIKLYGKLVDGTGTLVNQTDGGEGTLGVSRKGALNGMFGKKNIAVKGDKNPMRNPDIVARFKGCNNPMYGRVPSEKAGLPKKAIIGEKVGSNTKVSFESIREATRWLAKNGFQKADASSISKCCRGIRKSAYGYIWKEKQ